LVAGSKFSISHWLCWSSLQHSHSCERVLRSISISSWHLLLLPCFLIVYSATRTWSSQSKLQSITLCVCLFFSSAVKPGCSIDSASKLLKPTCTVLSLQKICGLHWWHKVPHAEMWCRANTHCMEHLLVVMQHQVRLVGQIIRMQSNRLPWHIRYSELQHAGLDGFRHQLRPGGRSPPRSVTHGHKLSCIGSSSNLQQNLRIRIWDPEWPLFSSSVCFLASTAYFLCLLNGLVVT